MNKKYFFYPSLLGISILGSMIGFRLAFYLDQNAIEPAYAQSDGQTLSAGRYDLINTQGKATMTIGFSSANTPAIWFYDKNGKTRLNMGIYEDGNSFVVLNDSNEQAVEIFRTVGGSSQPVLVFKANGQDRMIFGLNGQEGAPFLVTYDQKGQKKNVFGQY